MTEKLTTFENNSMALRMPKNYRISWISNITGYGGRGEYCLGCDEARAMVTDLNRQYRYITHIAERMEIKNGAGKKG